MFVNQVSIKELFSTNPGLPLNTRGHESNDSCTGDSGSQNNSQLPYSQLDFPDSLDCGSSQQFSSGQSQTSESPGRKFYQRYMAKGPLFSRENNSTQAKSQGSGTKLSFSDQLTANKIKAKDRDERDLLNSMLLTMKECAAEVKNAIQVVKENLREGIANSDNQIAFVMQKIEDQLTSQQTDFLKALEIKKEAMEENVRLKQVVIERESRIKELENKIREMQCEKEERVLEEVQKVHSIQQQAKEHMENLHQVFSRNQKELQHQTKQQEQRHHEIMQNSQNQHRQYQTYIREMEDRLQLELNNFSKFAKKEQIKLKKEWEEEIHHLQDLHKEEIEKLMQQQVRRAKNESLDNQTEVMQQHQGQLLDLQKRHKSELEAAVKQQVEYHSHQQQCQLEQMISNLWQKEQQRIKIMEREHQGMIDQENQRKLDEQLDALRERHQNEVMKLRQNQELQRHLDKNYPCDNRLRCGSADLEFRSQSPLTTGENRHSHFMNSDRKLENNCNSKSSWTSLSPYARVNVIDPSEFSRPIITKPTSQPIDTKSGWHKSFAESGAFVSPISTMAKTWSSKTLFSKSNPSPIVAVKPLVNNSIDQTTSNPSARVIAQEVVTTRVTRSKAVEASKPEPKKRKKRRSNRYGSKRRKGKSKIPNNPSLTDDICGVQQNESVPSQNNPVMLPGTRHSSTEQMSGIPNARNKVVPTSNMGNGSISHYELPVITPGEIQDRSSACGKTNEPKNYAKKDMQCVENVYDFTDEDIHSVQSNLFVNKPKKLGSYATSTDNELPGRSSQTDRMNQVDRWTAAVNTEPVAAVSRSCTLSGASALYRSPFASDAIGKVITHNSRISVSDSESEEDNCEGFDGTCSSGSSPSLSVTEVFIKRKIKQEKMSPLPITRTNEEGKQLVW